MPKKSSKPLSLEYIADRLDVDDPIFGFYVRTATPTAGVKSPGDKSGVGGKDSLASPAASASVPSASVTEGMLQGFVTVTTFTTWQKTFRFDSMHDSAFAFDDAGLAQDMLNGKRQYDRHGELAEELQATVRCGDPWNEGIVWPRIAEISLLGALGCGKPLLELVIERLESLPAKKTRNYDYVVLQATDNSVPFYESMGFVRVGCITENENFVKEEEASAVDEDKIQPTPELASDDSDSSDVAEAEQAASESAAKVEDAKAGQQESPNEVVSLEVFVYRTKKWEKVCDIAKRFKVQVWDIIFLNKDVYQDLVPSSYLMQDTELFIPAEQARYDATSNALQNQRKFGGKSRAIQWYFSEDNETPREIAKRFGVNCRHLIRANSSRIADLQPSSRLIENTRIQVSHFHIHNDAHVPYCHWTFPDDTLETSEPSYMMARKLHRKKRGGTKLKPVESSFSAEVTKYEPRKLCANSTSKRSEKATPGSEKKQKGSKKRERHPNEPIPPKRPPNAFVLFCTEVRAAMLGKPASEVTKVASEKWQNLPEVDKCTYKDMSQKAKAKYEELYQSYTRELEAFHKANPEWVAEQKRKATEKKPKTTLNLFNKVVQLNSEGVQQAGDEFQYYFVLTYLPDLQWCHLAPMRTVGSFGKDRPKSEGRPIWMLVDENEGKELDISAGCCEIVKSRATKHTEDADQEQWDIIESGACPPSAAPSSDSAAASGTVVPLAPIFTNRAHDGVTPSAEEPNPPEAEAEAVTETAGAKGLDHCAPLEESWV